MLGLALVMIGVVGLIGTILVTTLPVEALGPEPPRAGSPPAEAGETDGDEGLWGAPLVESPDEWATRVCDEHEVRR